MRKTTWNTYAMNGYTHDVANCQASAGGVHLHQIRKTPSGWQQRVLQSNGNHQAAGEVWSIPESEGEVKFERAKNY